MRAGFSVIIVAIVALVLGGWACEDDKSAKTDAGAAVPDASQEKTGAKKQAVEKKAAEEKKQKEEAAVDKRKEASSPNSATVPDKPPLDISSYLAKDDLKAYIGDRSLEAEPLSGKAPTPNYNTRHIHPGPDEFGVSLQVWSFDKSSEARKRLREMKPQYLNVESAPKSAPIRGSSAFVSERAAIRSYVFVHRKKNLVASVSCSVGICGSWKELMEISNKVIDRIDNPPKKKAPRPEPKAKEGTKEKGKKK